MSDRYPLATAVAALKAAAEPTRLRILMLLRDGELTVKDLTHILGQSQPRVSRHLKLISEAGLIERFREGSWVYFRLMDRGADGILVRRLIGVIDPQDATVARDRERAEALYRARAAAAQAYFQEHAGEWDDIRALHVAEAEVETAMRAALGEERRGLLVDLGTGTGRILELFADRYERGLGIDASRAMLTYARSRLERGRLHKAQVRLGDICQLPLGAGSADAVVMHQVLHFLSDPARAIREAARVLAPAGALLVVDFAPHGMEALRERFQHARLGFSDLQMRQWLGEAGLAPALSRTLTPDAAASDSKLTVALWLARRPGEAPERTQTPALETCEVTR